MRVPKYVGGWQRHCNDAFEQRWVEAQEKEMEMAKSGKKIPHTTIMGFGGKAIGEGRMKVFQEKPSAATAAPIVMHFIGSYAKAAGVKVAEVIAALGNAKASKAAKEEKTEKSKSKSSRTEKSTKKKAKPEKTSKVKKVAKPEKKTGKSKTSTKTTKVKKKVKR